MINRNFIGGAWVECESGDRYERHSPFDQSYIAAYQDSGEADVNRAVATARAAFDHGPWPKMTAMDRAGVFKRAAASLRAEVEPLATLMAREVGQPLAEQRKAVLGAADTLEYYANLVVSWREEAVYGQRVDGLGIVAQEPVGVVGSLTAWNAPLSLAHKSCPGMAAGCCLVVKPAHQTSGAVLCFAQILKDAGLPDGVFNVVTSARQNGAVVGQAICAHDDVDMVTFTGSSATGKAVMRAAAGNLKRLKLELGGKSPNVVFADADSLETAAASAASGFVRLAGQSCEAGSRVLVQRPVHDAFMQLLLAQVGRAKLGDPLDNATTCGPLVSRDQLDRTAHYVGVGLSEAKLVLGGGRPADEALSRGFFHEPTIFGDVDPAARLAQEEVFGPVLSVIPFDTVEEAVRIANQTRFGLVAGCWTSNINTAMRFARGVRSGGVWVNSYRDDAVLKHMPKGGFKQSGQGRELGPEGLAAFLETKSIMIKLIP